MSVHRFYLRPEASGEPLLELTGPEAHHASAVLRLRAGDELIILDGAGRELLCRVEDSSARKVAARVLQKRVHDAPPWRITLLQALPKGKLFEGIIEKATELGVHRIVPLLTERVVPQFNSKEAAVKAAKWQNVAVEAIKQSGLPWLPQVEVPLTVSKFLERKEKFDLALVGSLQPGSGHPHDQFWRFEQEHERRPWSLAVWIGPEGDFTAAELRAIQSAGAAPITLGPRVLRTETAAIYCLSIINYELQVPVTR